MRSVTVLLGLTVLGSTAICGTAWAQETNGGQGASEVIAFERVTSGVSHPSRKPGAMDGAHAGFSPIQAEESLAPSEQNSAATWWKLAMSYQDAARFVEAERAYGKAMELMKPGGPVALADVMDCLGTMYVQMGRLAEGEQLERKALGMRQEHKDSLGVGLSWMHLAMLSMGKHENADSEMYAELAVERLVPEKGESAATDEQKMTALTYLALARCGAHACKDSMKPLQRAMTIAESSYADKSFPVSYVRFLEGYVDWKRGNDRAAARLMKIGTEGMETQLGWRHPTFVTAVRQYESFLVATRRTAQAMEVREKLTGFVAVATRP